MTTIRVKDSEPFEVAMRRFKRTMEKKRLTDGTSRSRVLRKAYGGAQAQEGGCGEASFQASAWPDAAKEVLLILALPRFRFNGAATSNR
jgi:Ribosomal protein S21